MTTIHVQSESHAYDITIGENIRFQLKQYVTKKYSAIMIVTDDQVANLYLDDICSNFQTDHLYQVIVPSGEKSKSIETYYHLQTKAIENGLDRQSLIIALGGGVIGDLAGFVAATYMRGIDYIQIPTTILAHDSSVGGKVAINHEQGKNLIGNFYPPQAVIYDVGTLKSLTESEIRSGYAELVKEALISDHAFFNELMNVKLNTLSNEQLKEHLRKGIEVKASIVESDEKEAGIRMFLNLGHTLAHALEADLGYGSLTHGEAVAIGLLFALKVSEDHFSAELPIQKLLHWLRENNYPIQLNEMKLDNILSLMKRDKKVVNNTIQMVLLKEIGSPAVVKVMDDHLKNLLDAFTREMVVE